MYILSEKEADYITNKLAPKGLLDVSKSDGTIDFEITKDVIVYIGFSQLENHVLAKLNHQFTDSFIGALSRMNAQWSGKVRPYGKPFDISKIMQKNVNIGVSSRPLPKTGGNSP